MRRSNISNKFFEKIKGHCRLREKNVILRLIDWNVCTEQVLSTTVAVARQGHFD